jgi:hypothetical protein
VLYRNPRKKLAEEGSNMSSAVCIFSDSYKIFCGTLFVHFHDRPISHTEAGDSEFLQNIFIYLPNFAPLLPT